MDCSILFLLCSGCSNENGVLFCESLSLVQYDANEEKKTSAARIWTHYICTVQFPVASDQYTGVSALLPLRLWSERFDVVLRLFALCESRLEHNLLHSECIPHLSILDHPIEVSLRRTSVPSYWLKDLRAHLLYYHPLWVLLILSLPHHQLLRRWNAVYWWIELYSPLQQYRISHWLRAGVPVVRIAISCKCDLFWNWVPSRIFEKL